jgi:hypothetical protein
MSLNEYIDEYLKLDKHEYNIDFRLLKSKIIKKYLKKLIPFKNNKLVCLNGNGDVNLLNYFTEKKKIGSKSKYGDIYKTKIPINNKLTEKLAIKLIPLSYNDRINLYNTKFNAWRELKAMYLINKVIKNRICPNIPLMYEWYICNNCTYDNINLQNLKSKTCLILLIELAETDLRNWVIQKSLNNKLNKNMLIETWYNIFFQIFTTLNSIYKYHNLVHHDLHWSNVLLSKVKPGGYWIYKVNNFKFYIPNVGIFIQVCDFGKCLSKTKFLLRETDFVNKQNISNISSHKQISPNSDINKITNIPYWIQNTFMIKNKKVIPNEIIQLLNNIKKINKQNIFILLKKVFFKYLNNRIGRNIQNKEIIDKNEIKNISYLNTGEIIEYKNKYAMIDRFKSDMIYIITNINIYLKVEKVKLNMIHKLNKKIKPNPNIDGFEYLKEKPLNIYRT